MFCLLQNKDSVTYNEVVSSLMNRAEELHLELNQAQIISDFEAASVGAFRRQFQQTLFTGCWFHFKPAIWKYIQSRGLVCQYRDDHALRTFFRVLTSIPFLPENKIAPFFAHYLGESIADRDDLGENFTPEFFVNVDAYFHRTWLNKVDQLCIFHSSIRTNNGCESFNAKLSRVLNRCRPNVYHVIDFLKKEESIRGRLEQLSHGNRIPSRKTKYVQLDDKVSRLKAQFSSGLLCDRDYTDRIAALVSEFD